MVVGLFGESSSLAVVGGVGGPSKMGKGLLQSYRSDRCFLTGCRWCLWGTRQISLQTGVYSLCCSRQRKVSCTEAQSSCSPSWLCLRQDLHHVAQAILL